ncbi:aspartate/tyrosine/aromatic aminotransferase [Azotobacter chroococcum]|uniref:amino acid aminotransferase n=1 Tax=Azotobacter chroococcum TaxID=353 RepID=UPI0010390066|nr:amino acid aminotransferase [Azotobacter chroococcum]TBW33994.1 aspartate/tyrosine/aromatic aminotransferase [Azotobacter chroococcum]
MLEHVPVFPGDPILTVNEAFRRDTRPFKVNLSIGVYLDEEGNVPVMQSVHIVERRIAAEARPRPYLPMEGLAAMRQVTGELLFGSDSQVMAEGRVATVQTVGSSGALRLAAEFIAVWLPGYKAAVSSPTWENHRAIFNACGVEVVQYPYYDPATKALAFDDMLQGLEHLPQCTAVVLHACCHNPTGVDLNESQWDAVIDLLVRRKLLPIIDFAYQGYGRGIEEDAYAVRRLADSGLTFMVANSFSKNMSVYGERAGALSVVLEPACVDNVLGQMQSLVRRLWSNPPAHAAYIVADILTSEDLSALWRKEVNAMRSRILGARQLLFSHLGSSEKYRYLLNQVGMFSYTGLRLDQVEQLKEQYGIYLVPSGRICVASLNAANMPYVAEALKSVDN